jgi:NAD(P)H-binding
MHEHGPRRLVCVSSSATFPERNPEGGFFFEKVLQPFVINFLGRTLYEDLQRMERLVTSSDLDWVIARPSGLFDTPGVTAYKTAEAHLNRATSPRGRTSRTACSSSSAAISTCARRCRSRPSR